MWRLFKLFTYRLFILLALIAALAVGNVIVPNVTQAAPPAQFQSDDSAATRTLGMVNEWRLSEGLMPLELNPVLQRMAQAQAEYILPRLSSIGDEEQYHHDAKGRSAIARAVEVYDWPDFYLPQRVEVGENAAQYNVKGAVDFWKGSPIHKKTATNPTYREVGIVALPLPAKGTYLFYMCFGARPDKLTALLAPDGGTLYLSREFSKYSPEKKSDPSIQLFDSNRVPLGEPMPYTQKIAAPKSAGGKFYVKYILPKRELWDEVITTRDQVILSNSALSVNAQLAAVNDEETIANKLATSTAIALVPNDPATSTPTAIRATFAPTVQPPTHTPLAPTPTSLSFTQRPEATTPISTAQSATATQTITQTATQAINGQPDVIVFYSSRTLFVLNAAKHSLKLDGLKVGRLSIDAWLSVTKLPASGLPVGGCLQASVLGIGDEAPPTACKHVWGVVDVTPQRAFWTLDAFDVSVNGSVLRTCALNANTCEIKLP